jgi:deferrochelatase/peroxidase EfeB
VRAYGFVTVAIPFRGKGVEVEQLLRDETYKGNRPKHEWVKALRRPPQMIHFLSMAVVDPRSPMDDFTPPSRDGVSLLMIEVTSDTGATETLQIVAKALEKLLRKVLDLAAPEGWSSSFDVDELALFMKKHHLVIGDEWDLSMGQVHDGSPSMTVQRIIKERDLARQISHFIDRKRDAKKQCWLESSHAQRLDSIRNWLWTEGCYHKPIKWAFVAEPTRVLEGPPDPKYAEITAGISIARKLLWPLYILLALVLLDRYFVADVLVAEAHVKWPLSYCVTATSVVGLLLFAFLGWLRRPRKFPFTTLVASTVITIALFHSFGDAFEWLFEATASIVVVAAIAAALIYWHLRIREDSDPADDHTPDAARVCDLMKDENYFPQNHMFTISTIKRGLPRWLALRSILTVIGTNLCVSRPGFLGKNGVIHAARWLWISDPKLPWFRFYDAGRLIFWSNYDGTWESYVGDFVADSPDGVTGLWSNCLGFPHAKNLIDDGAKNRDRLVRWARRQQKPTTFWYSAYPKLTNARIRTNAAIRQGIASAQTDADARDWMSLFGSQPRPPESLAMRQIPTLIFGGLSSLGCATCYMIHLCGSRQEQRQWLSDVRESVTFGELLPGQKSAVALALAVTALRKLGVPENSIDTFPVPFQEGMWTDERARALGDEDCNRPDRWKWGAEARKEDGKTIDVFVVIYGEGPDEVRDEEDRLLRSLPGGRLNVRTKKLKERPKKDAPVSPDSKSGSPSDAEKNEVDGPVVLDATAQTKRASVCPCAPPAPSRYLHEAFGFADGVSQPVIRGLRRSGARAAHNDLVGPGEFVLGYPDSLDRIPPTPLIDPSTDPDHLLADDAVLAVQRPDFSHNQSTGRRDLGANGTFLVVRDLAQHVDAWQNMLKDEAEQVVKNFVVSVGKGGAGIVWGDPKQTHGNLNNVASADLEHAIAAKLVGRWQDGSPLVRNPMVPGGESASFDNSFRFGDEDPQGLACPLGAHMRRANPRDTRFPKSQEEIDSVNRHRLLRIGRPYRYADQNEKDEDEDEQEKDEREKEGLMFMCLNADIERQFEFVQKSWLLNRNMSALENETDPMLGPGGTFSIPTPGGNVKLKLPRLVTVRGGGYFFMPGAATLQFLTTLGPPVKQQPTDGTSAAEITGTRPKRCGTASIT